MRIYSLLAVVLLGTVQSLRQIHIGVPRNARSFIQQQSEETNPPNKPDHPTKRDVIFEHYPTLIPSTDQATQIYEETSSTDSFRVKRLFSTLIHDESLTEKESPKTDLKVSQELLLPRETAENETKIKNSHEDKFKEVRKDRKTKNDFLIYREDELHKKEIPKISIDQYHENFLGKQHVIKQKNEEIDEISVNLKTEETKNLAEVTKFIDDLETLQNSSFVTDDEISFSKNLTSFVDHSPKISEQEKQKLNDLDSKTTVLPKSAEPKLEPSTTTKSPRKKAKKILYSVDEFQKPSVQGFPNDKQTTISSAKIPKSPKFSKRFKLDDPEDEKPEELLIFKRARERTTAIPVTVMSTVTPAQSSFIIEDEEVNIQETTLKAEEEKDVMERVITTTEPTTTTKKSKKRRRRRKKSKKKKYGEQKIEQLSSIGSFKTALVDEPAFKVLASKTFVDGSTFSSSKEDTSEKDLEAKIPSRAKPKSHQYRKRTIAPYKSQIKQYFVTTAPKEVIEMPAIVDKETQIGYTGRQLAQMCDETKHMGHSWGISDISDFAQKNCPLIRLYYPNVSCSQINQFVAYCNTNHLF